MLKELDVTKLRKNKKYKLSTPSIDDEVTYKGETDEKTPGNKMYQFSGKKHGSHLISKKAVEDQIEDTELDEENVTGNIGVGAGPIQTPKAFKKKNEAKGVTGAAPAKGSRIFIPKGFELPEAMFKPYTIQGEDRKLFKIVSKKQGDESVLLIDDLARVGLGAIEKGRTSFEKEQRLPIVTQILKDIVPGAVRGIIKKATSGVSALPNGYVPVPVKITREDITGFGAGSSVKNSPVQITERGIKLLKAMKEDPAKFEGVLSPSYVQFLIYLFKNKDKKVTPAQFSSESGAAVNGVSRLANSMAENNFITMEKSAEPEGEMTNKWYIFNPGASEDTEVKGIGTTVYETIQNLINTELLNESSYNKFKNEVKYRTKSEQLHKAIREVKRKLQDIDRIVEYTQRMKHELSEGDGIQYWTRTEKAVAQISEMVNHLNNKIKNLQQ
jgi:hypothetical protein